MAYRFKFQPSGSYMGPTPTTYFDVEASYELVRKGLASLEKQLEKARKEYEVIPEKVKRVGVPFAGVGKLVELFPGVKEKEEKIKEIENLESAVRLHQELLARAEKDPGKLKDFGRGILSTFREPEKLIPFARLGFSLDENLQTIKAAQKLERGEELTPLEKSLIEKARAKGLPIERNWTYFAGKAVGQMPSYLAEIGGLHTLVATPIEHSLLAKFGKGAEIAIPSLFQKGWEVPATFGINQLFFKGIGIATQAGVWSAMKLPADISEKAIPYQKQLRNPYFPQLYSSLGNEFEWKKEMIKSFGSNFVEILTEYTGGIVARPLDLLGKATLGRYLGKLGIDLTSETFDRIARRVGWHGIIGEVFEEELAELLQAPIEEREYKAVWTPEGFERLLAETLAIIAFGGISRVPFTALDLSIKAKESLAKPPEVPKVIPRGAEVKEIVPYRVPPEIPKWGPLEKTISAEWRAGFMWMGRVGDIHRYKHGITRHYLNIDSAGETYRYDSKTDKYFPIDKEKAIENVYEGIEELRGIKGMPATRETPYSKAYISEKIKALREAGFDVVRWDIERPEAVSKFLSWLSKKEKRPEVKPVVKPEEFFKTTVEVPRTETPTNISELSNEWKIAFQEKNTKRMAKLSEQWKGILEVEESKTKIAPKGKGFYDYIRPHFVIPPDVVYKGLTALSKGWFVSGTKTFKKMGRYGKELARFIEAKEADSGVRAGEMKEDMRKAGAYKLSKEEQWSVIAISEDLPKIPVDNPKVRKIAELWKEHQKVITDFTGGLDFVVMDSEGTPSVFSPITNYFVHFNRLPLLDKDTGDKDYQKEVIDFTTATGIFPSKEFAEGFVKSYQRFRKTGEKDKEFLVKLAEKNKKSLAEMESIWRRFIYPNVPRRFGPLEKLREFDLPLYDSRLEILFPEFYTSVWERAYHIKYLGQRDEIARRLIDKMGQDGFDFAFANRVYDIITGKGTTDPELRGVTQVLVDLQTMELVYSAILQPTQLVAPTIFAGWRRTIEGVRKTLNEANREDVRRAGVTLNRSYYQAISGFAKQRIGERIVRFFRLPQADEIMRIIAGNVAPGVLEDCLKNPFEKFNKQRLLDLLIFPEDVARVIRTGKFTPEDIKRAQFRLAKITQHTYRREDLPPYWRKNTEVSLMSMFKGFIIQQTEFLQDYVFKNPKRIPTWLLATLTFVTPIAVMRRLIRGKPIKNILDIFGDVFSLAFLGIWSEIIVAAQYMGGLTHWVAGPLYGDIASALGYAFTGNIKRLLDLAAPYMAGMTMSPEVAAGLYLFYQTIKRRTIFPYEKPKGFPKLKR